MACSDDKKAPVPERQNPQVNDNSGGGPRICETPIGEGLGDETSGTSGGAQGASAQRVVTSKKLKKLLRSILSKDGI